MLKILIVCIWFPQMRINSFYTEANPNVPLMIVFLKDCCVLVLQFGVKI